jgi:hypothetical protein
MTQYTRSRWVRLTQNINQNERNGLIYFVFIEMIDRMAYFLLTMRSWWDVHNMLYQPSVTVLYFVKREGGRRIGIMRNNVGCGCHSYLCGTRGKQTEKRAS